MMRAIAAALLVALLAGPARADDDDAAPAPPAPPREDEDPARTLARQLKDEGTQALDRDDPALALEKFRAAYDAFRSPNLRFNLGLALARLGRDAEALTEFEAFLETAPGAPEDARLYAHAQMVTLKPRVGRVVVRSTTAGAELAVDGKPVGVTPLARPIYLAPGAHDVDARKLGFTSFAARVRVAAGAELTLDVSFAPVSERRRQLAPIIVGVLAVATLAAGAGLRVSAQLDYDDLAIGGSHQCAPNCPPSAWQGIRQREYVGDALLVGGGLAAAADVLLWILDGRMGRAQPRAALVPTGNGAALCGRF
jgi:PEGA domain